MQTVHAEDVRNYHWEFYREMNDVRNDTGTAFSRKNPFAYRIGFGSAPEPFALNEWHKLQIVQNGGKILGAIDGKILLVIDDNSRTNTGCILNYGHIAIGCMVHSGSGLPKPEGLYGRIAVGRMCRHCVISMVFRSANPSRCPACSNVFEGASARGTADCAAASAACPL